MKEWKVIEEDGEIYIVSGRDKRKAYRRHFEKHIGKTLEDSRILHINPWWHKEKK